MKILNTLTILYLLVAVAEIISEYAFHPLGVYFTKPLLMPILMVYTFKMEASKQTKFSLIASLIGSTLGDIFLMFTDEIYFLLGLGSFFIAHIFYVIYFIRNTSFQSIPISKRLLFALPFVVYIGFFFWLLIPSLLAIPKGSEMIPPIIGYGFILAGMGLTSVYFWKSVNRGARVLAVFGSLLFIASDSMIALNKFILPIPAAAFLIMFTYILAQYLIIKSAQNAANT